MAADWIKMEICLAAKPEVIQIGILLGVNKREVVGILHMVWGWFDQHTTEGNAVGVPPAFLDEYVGVPKTSQAMEAVGWLVVDDEGIRLPNFGDHNGQSAKRRAQTNKRKVAYRANLGTPVERIERSSNTPKGVPREEKRREDSNTTPLPPSKGDDTPKKKPATPAAIHDSAVSEAVLPEVMQTPAIQEAWDKFCQSRRQSRKYLTMLAIEGTIGKLVKFPADVIETALLDSVANSWQGVFPEKAKPAGRQDRYDEALHFVSNPDDKDDQW